MGIIREPGYEAIILLHGIALGGVLSSHKPPESLLNVHLDG